MYDCKLRFSLEHNLWSKFMILAYDLAYDPSIIHFFKVLATVITIVNYDRKTFIVQASGVWVFISVKPFQPSLLLHKS